MDINLDKQTNTGYSTLLQSKIDALKTQSKVQRNFSADEKAKLAETAKGFESIFTTMVYKGMKSAMLDSMKDESESSDMSFGADTLNGVTDMAFADYMTNTGQGLGIAAMMFKQITGEEISSVPKQTTAGAGNFGSLQTKSPSAIDSALNKTIGGVGSKDYTPIQFNVANNNQKNLASGNLIERVKDRIKNYEPIIQHASRQYNVPSSLIKAVITAESAGNINAKSAVGAKGLMQLMDGTAKELGVNNSFDPKQNILGGAKYIRQMLNTFGGDLDKAIAAYNAGPGNVKKYGGIPPFNETQNYVKKVKQHLAAFS